MYCRNLYTCSPLRSTFKVSDPCEAQALNCLHFFLVLIAYKNNNRRILVSTVKRRMMTMFNSYVSMKPFESMRMRLSISCYALAFL
jgi:hypothetical protein